MCSSSSSTVLLLFSLLLLLFVIFSLSVAGSAPHFSTSPSSSSSSSSSVGKDMCWVLLGARATTPPMPSVKLEVVHHSFETEWLVASLTYTVKLRTMETVEFILEAPSSPDGDNAKNAVWVDHGSTSPCPETLRGRTAISGRLSNVTTLKWKAPHLATQSSANFRLRYRPMSGRDSGIYEVQLTLPLREACVLQAPALPWQFQLDSIPSSPLCMLMIPAPAGHAVVLTVTELSIRGVVGLCSSRGVDLLPLSVDLLPAWATESVDRLKSSWDWSAVVAKPSKLCGELSLLSPSQRMISWPGPLLLRLRLPGGRSSGDALNFEARAAPPCGFRVGSDGGVVHLHSDWLSSHCEWTFQVPFGHRASLEARFLGDGGPATHSLGTQCSGSWIGVRDSGGEQWRWCDDASSPLVGVSKRILSSETRLTLALYLRGGASYSFTEVQLRFTATSSTLDQCPSGWVAGPGRSGTSCFRLEEQLLSWTSAQQWCLREGGRLAVINRAETQAFLDAMLQESAGFDSGRGYWIGASDVEAEGAFRWTDGTPLSYTNWFPGWNGGFGAQPSDDGLADEDCVELRRRFVSVGGKASRTAPRFFWNDRRCDAQLAFVCQKNSLDKGVDADQTENPNKCNRTLSLSVEQPTAIVTSPAYPALYPDGALCTVNLTAPAGMRLALHFNDFRLESGHGCPYDFVEISESSDTGSPRKWCGDWSDRLKLLQIVTAGEDLRLTFSSDASHRFEGFKARVVLENALDNDCPDSHLKRFGDSCFLFVAFPEVTWFTAKQICSGMKAGLASVLSPEQQTFLLRQLTTSSDFTRRTFYWLGGHSIGGDDNWRWNDKYPLNYSAWHPLRTTSIYDEACLSLQWAAPSGKQHGSGFYWRPQPCHLLGGYVCQRDSKESGLAVALNRTYRGVSGVLSSLNFPSGYYPNLHYSVNLEGPPSTRLVLQFSRLELEAQAACLYDFIEISDDMGLRRRLCGVHEGEELHNLTFVSGGPHLSLTFHSDASGSGAGFSAAWRAVNMSACPESVLEASASENGEIITPNYPHFYMENLQCTYSIQAPRNHRVWLRFSVLEVGQMPFKDICDVDTDVVEINLDDNDSTTLQLCGNLTGKPWQTRFLSYGSVLNITLKSTKGRRGRGFVAHFKAVTRLKDQSLVLVASGIENQAVELKHINYPLKPPQHIRVEYRLLAPPGHMIQLQLRPSSASECSPGENILVKDIFGDVSLSLCNGGVISRRKKRESLTPLVTVSRFHWLHIFHITEEGNASLTLEAQVIALPDPNFKAKILAFAKSEWKIPKGIDTCAPTEEVSGCTNNGRCMDDAATQSRRCRCPAAYTGPFCALTVCDVQPCANGVCEVVLEGAEGFRCRCPPGLAGPVCDRKYKPCESNPCEGRGECLEKNFTFFCRCHAWWEGARCERRMTHIPYKPLSERMLREPFWLGLITVSVVLGAIALGWCIKRHFPERLERLLAEDDKRGQLSPCLATPIPLPPTPPRSLLSRLGLRKPSLLSLASVASMTTPQAHESRTFSLDDLLRPRRTPSPRHRRQMSAPSKRDHLDRRHLLQQLVSSSSTSDPGSRRRSAESIAMEQRSLNNPSETDSVTGGFDRDPRAEKKVTFAQLLNRVSAEMSSSTSDVSTAEAIVANSRPPLHRSEATEDELDSRPPRRLAKISSADSILHLLRGLTGGRSSRAPSPSPNASEVEDVSAPSSPRGSLSEGGPLQVPVLDAVAGGSFPTGNALVTLEVPREFGLSPIREMPTPLPSPAHTPLLPRGNPMMMQQKANPTFWSQSKDDSDPEERIQIVVEPPSSNANDTDEDVKPIIAVPRITISETLTDDSEADACPEDKAAAGSSPFPSVVSSPTSTHSVISTFDSAPRSRSQSLEVAPPAIFLFPPEDVGNDPVTLATSPGLVVPVINAPSESNLSSSGYSSLTSPAPSRCSSTNPLCNESPSPAPSTSSRLSPQRLLSPISLTSPEPPSPTSLQFAGTNHLTVATALLVPSQTPPQLKLVINSAPEHKTGSTDSPDEGFEGDNQDGRSPSLSPGLAQSLSLNQGSSSRSESPVSVGTLLTLPTESEGPYDASSGGPSRPQCNDRDVTTSHPLTMSENKTSPGHRSKFVSPRRRRRKWQNGNDASVEWDGGDTLDGHISGEEDNSVHTNCTGVQSAQLLTGNSLPDPIHTSPVARRKHLRRLRAIAHQIRFLRRLETSLRQRAPNMSPLLSSQAAADSRQHPPPRV